MCGGWGGGGADNDIGAEGAAAVARALESGRCGLTTLHLGGEWGGRREGQGGEGVCREGRGCAGRGRGARLCAVGSADAGASGVCGGLGLCVAPYEGA